MRKTYYNDSSYGEEYNEEDLANRVRRYIDTQEKRAELMEQELPIVEEDLDQYRHDKR